MPEKSNYAKDVLVTTDWVAEHAGDEDVVVAEVDENPDLYAEGHIPGAVRLHWKDELQDPVIRDVISPREFERLMETKGISNGTTVVLYGDKNNWFAAYAYWYLKLYGHEDVRIMDGGRQKWLDEERDLSSADERRPYATYRVAEHDPAVRAQRDDVLEIVRTGSDHLVDVRSPQEY